MEMPSLEDEYIYSIVLNRLIRLRHDQAPAFALSKTQLVPPRSFVIVLSGFPIVLILEPSPPSRVILGGNATAEAVARMK